MQQKAKSLHLKAMPGSMSKQASIIVLLNENKTITDIGKSILVNNLIFKIRLHNLEIHNRIK